VVLRVALWRLHATGLAGTHQGEEERGDADGDEYAERETADPKRPPDLLGGVRRAWEEYMMRPRAARSLSGQPLSAAVWRVRYCETPRAPPRPSIESATAPAAPMPASTQSKPRFCVWTRTTATGAVAFAAVSIAVDGAVTGIIDLS
jgi:hypothetical protein